MESLTSAFTRS